MPDIIRDDRAESFFQIGDLTKLIAEIHCGLDIDDTTHQRWRELLGLLREFDTLVDDTDISHEDALAHLESFEIFTDRYPSLNPESLPADNRAALLGRTASLLSLGEQISTTRDLDEFVELRVAEGAETSLLLQDSATPEVTSTAEFSGRFLPVMRSLGVTACLLDSISDAKADAREGSLAIPPDRTFYARLGREVTRHAGPGLRALQHPPIIRHFGTMSLTRLKNRINHGRRPYSSLRNFTV